MLIIKLIMEKSIVNIQKYIRRYLIRKKNLIPESCYQTKIWRQNRNWYKNGKSNECEKYQINSIEKILNIKLEKTNDRIDMENNEIINKRNINANVNAYDFTENFDGKFVKNDNIYYFNLKFVCDKGVIIIPPKHTFVKSSFIKHLYKSLTLYKSNIFLSFDLFRAKYGGFVMI
jgi:hypothetical protein